VIVFVAVDDAGKPVAVPGWTPDSDEDVRLSEYALKVMELSKGIESTIARYHPAAE
jgi:acyl-CoA hydrolase